MSNAAKRSVAKRHHLVPQFYLRGFAHNDRLISIRLDGREVIPQSVRNAASVTNFYALEGHPDGNDAFERALSFVEGETAKVVDKVVSGTWPLSAEDRGTLGYFVALQVVRGQDHRRTMEFVMAQHARLEIGASGRAGVKGWFERNIGVELTDEQASAAWDEAIQPSGPPLSVPAAMHVKQIIDLSDELLPAILGRPWLLVDFDRRSLITSDSPVGLVRDPKDTHPFLGVGFYNAQAVTFPLTRKLAILMLDPVAISEQMAIDKVAAGLADFRQPGSTALEKEINRHTAASASEWLFHHPDDDRFLPSELPKPRPVKMRIAGGPPEFSGEPLFDIPDGSTLGPAVRPNVPAP